MIDGDAQVELVNKCALEQKNLLRAYTYRDRMGNVMGCINALSCRDGCGGSRNCVDCPVRKAVGEAIEGKNVFRDQAVFQLLVDGQYVPVHIWITASLLRYNGRDFIVMILEDIAEMIQETKLVPICQMCGKVGDGVEYHESLNAYIQGRFHSDGKNDLCDDCKAKAK